MAHSPINRPTPPNPLKLAEAARRPRGASFKPHSKRLFLAEEGDMKPLPTIIPDGGLRARAREARAELGRLVSLRDYPCVAARAAFENDEYMIGHYGELGSGEQSFSLARDLDFFLHQLDSEPDRRFLTLFAVFDEGSSIDGEAEFEKRLWRELSFVSALDALGAGWDPAFSADPEDEGFCFSFRASAFFVVGMHPFASRLSRQTPWPALVFNAYKQFSGLAARGEYEPMVKRNRERDMRFQGNLNPMVERYGDVREAIQFSGRDNPSDWKCPFHRGLKKPGK